MSKFTFGEFADNILMNMEKFVAKTNVKRLDIVAEKYQRYSIKGTRCIEAKVVYRDSDILSKLIPRPSSKMMIIKKFQ